MARLTGMMWEQRLSPPLSTDVGNRLGLLGGQIRDAGETAPRDMAEAMSHAVGLLRSGFLKTLERQWRSEEELPPWYRRDLIRLLEVNRVALDDPRPPELVDIPEAGADPAAWVLALWREYGAALQAWPEILAAHGETESGG